MLISIILICLLQTQTISSNYNNFTYNYLHEPILKCRRIRDLSTKLIILVKTSTINVNRREIIRRTWNRKFDDFTSKIIFELGLPNDKDLQAQIDRESTRYGDILQGNFVDTYHNLTMKSIMGFKWATKNCNKTDFILVADDDNVISVLNLLKLLRTLDKHDMIYMGHLYKESIPIRDFDDKYFISFEEYGNETYPPYISGTAILFSFQTFSEITEMIPFFKSFWIEDAYIGVLAKAANILPTHNPHFHLKRIKDDKQMIVASNYGKFEKFKKKRRG